MDQSDISPNTSNQQLVVNGDNDSATALLQEKQSRRSDSLNDVTFVEYMTVLTLCFVNLINYMDRFTLAGVLSDVKTEFDIGDDKAGLLQTVFVVAYMVFAPIFGYLGDRYSRRAIMVFGVALWSMTTFLGSFIGDYAWFAVFRGLVGIGEASYSTIAPTIISDLFVGNVRSKMLAFFYFAIPVGRFLSFVQMVSLMEPRYFMEPFLSFVQMMSLMEPRYFMEPFFFLIFYGGMGYIVGSVAGAAAGNWRWGLRVTPFLGAVAVALIIWVMKDPERGAAEDSHMKPTSYRDDLRSLAKNPSFMLATIAFTCVAFVTGALAWWGPQFIYLGLNMQDDVDITLERVSLYFGGITMAAGLLGVPIGSWLGTVLVKRYPSAHPIICGAGLLLSAPAITLSIISTEGSFYAPFVLMFLGEMFLNLNWAIVADMSLYVVIPPRRSTAEAFQILISHMFGDAGSPYLVGVISESLKTSVIPVTMLEEAPVDRNEFQSLQYALFVTCFVEVLGGIFFLLTAIYIVRDKLRVDRAIAEADAQRTEPSHRSAHNAGD